MADYLPQATGNWSTTTWITAFSNLTAFAGGNTPPTFIDDVYADGKTITIDINTAVRSIRTTTTPRTGGLAGGGFNPTNGVTLTADALAGTTNCINFSLNNPNTFTLFGNVSSSNTSNGAGINITSSGIVNVIGSAYAGAAASAGAISVASTGTLYLTGNVFGSQTAAGGKRAIVISNANCYVYGDVYSGWGGSTTGNDGIAIGAGYLFVRGNLYGATVGGNTNPGAIFLNGTGIVDIVGNALSGTPVGANQSSGTIQNTSSSTINLTGNVYGNNNNFYVGALNSSSGTINIYGTVFGGIGSVGANNSSTGTMYITKVVGNAFGLGSVGIGGFVGLANSQNGRAYVEQVEFGPRGQTPISGPVYILPSNRNTLTGYTTALGTSVTFYNSLSVNGLLPPVSSVQAGVVYNVGNSIGTMAVPSASAVQFGVAVDNTVGTAALQPQDVWGYARLSATQVDSMGDRLRNTATTQSIGYQIASFNL